MSINILKDFISENAGPISVKFHVQLQGKDWERGVGVRGWVGGFYLNGSGHMTKMVATFSPYMALT